MHTPCDPKHLLLLAEETLAASRDLRRKVAETIARSQAQRQSAQERTLVLLASLPMPKRLLLLHSWR